MSPTCILLVLQVNMMMSFAVLFFSTYVTVICFESTSKSRLDLHVSYIGIFLTLVKKQKVTVLS